jgi:hypothetical protein
MEGKLTTSQKHPLLSSCLFSSQNFLILIHFFSLLLFSSYLAQPRYLPWLPLEVTFLAFLLPSMNAAPLNLINSVVIFNDLTLHRQISILHAAHAHPAARILRSKQNPPPLINRGGKIDSGFLFQSFHQPHNLGAQVRSPVVRLQQTNVEWFSLFHENNQFQFSESLVLTTCSCLRLLLHPTVPKINK